MTVQNHRPKIAIIDPNTLATLGLKQLLLNMMPIVTVDTFGTLAELEANDADIYAHYFVSLDIVLANRAYFVERRRKTIVLTLSLTDSTQPSLHQSARAPARPSTACPRATCPRSRPESAPYPSSTTTENPFRPRNRGNGTHRPRTHQQRDCRPPQYRPFNCCNSPQKHHG